MSGIYIALYMSVTQQRHHPYSQPQTHRTLNVYITRSRVATATSRHIMFSVFLQFMFSAFLQLSQFATFPVEFISDIGDQSRKEVNSLFQKHRPSPQNRNFITMMFMAGLLHFFQTDQHLQHQTFSFWACICMFSECIRNCIQQIMISDTPQPDESPSADAFGLSGRSLRGSNDTGSTAEETDDTYDSTPFTQVPTYIITEEIARLPPQASHPNMSPPADVFHAVFVFLEYGITTPYHLPSVANDFSNVFKQEEFGKSRKAIIYAASDFINIHIVKGEIDKMQQDMRANPGSKRGFQHGQEPNYEVIIFPPTAAGMKAMFKSMAQHNAPPDSVAMWFCGHGRDCNYNQNAPGLLLYGEDAWTNAPTNWRQNDQFSFTTDSYQWYNQDEIAYDVSKWVRGREVSNKKNALVLKMYCDFCNCDLSAEFSCILDKGSYKFTHTTPDTTQGRFRRNNLQNIKFDDTNVLLLVISNGNPQQQCSDFKEHQIVDGVNEAYECGSLMRVLAGQLGKFDGTRADASLSTLLHRWVHTELNPWSLLAVLSPLQNHESITVDWVVSSNHEPTAFHTGTQYQNL